ncbi:MAG: DUF3299 domain-containing protein [Pseudomonadota bacterium]
MSKAVHILVTSVLISLDASAAFAFQETPVPPALEDIWKPAQTPDGGVSWQILESTKELQRLDDEGYIISKPEFSPQVKALEGKTIKVAGWMMPLENGSVQQHFVLLGYPPGCPFHMHAGPLQFIEVRSLMPIQTQIWDPIIIEGTLTLTGYEEGGVFYQIADGRMLTP